HDITVEPLAQVPPVWVAGGRQYAHEASPDRPRMDPKVLDRIVRWDGWIARPTSPPEQIAEDLREIDEELSRRGQTRAQRGFTVAHENFCWLTEKTRPDDIEAVYLTGSIDRIQQRIQERIDVGVEHMFLHTMTADVEQLELFAKHL